MRNILLVAGLISCMSIADPMSINPYLYKNSKFNFDNSKFNFDNSKFNYKNNPYSLKNNRIIRNLDGDPVGFVVPKKNQGLNVFDIDGDLLGYE